MENEILAEEKIQQLNQMLEIDIENDLIANLAGSINFAIAPLYEEAKVPPLVATFNLRDQDKLKPVIDKCFPIEKTAEAFRYFGEGRFKGKIVVTLRM